MLLRVVDETGDVFDVSTHAGAGWSSKTTYPWINWIPMKWPFPRQGWKIHVSATSRTRRP